MRQSMRPWPPRATSASRRRPCRSAAASWPSGARRRASGAACSAAKAQPFSRRGSCGRFALRCSTPASARDSPNVVETPRGRVRAREVVIAINAAAAGWRPLRRHLTAFGSYVVLTESAPELLEAINWTGGESIVDGRMFLHYFRTTNDGRVLMGSGSGPIGFGGRIDERFTADAPSGARAEAGVLLPPPRAGGAPGERTVG